MSLEELYEKRMKGVKLDTEEDFIQLLSTNEKLFYFSLMYFYLTNRNLKTIIRFSPILSNAVTLFCISAGDTDITKYYSKYTNLEEIPEQINKICEELYNN